LNKKNEKIERRRIMAKMYKGFNKDMTCRGYKYEEGKTATLVVLPAEGYEFVQWSDGVKDNPRIVVVTENKTYTAEFKKKEAPKPEYTVTVYVSPAETGTVEGAGTYKEGEKATLVAIPVEGYEFIGWSDGTNANPYEIVVDKNITLIANFQKKDVVVDEFTITVYVTPEGTGEVMGTGTFKAGETATLVAIPAIGYQFSKWSDGNTDNPREIVVEKNWTLICTFEKISDGLDAEQGAKSQESGQKIMREGRIYIVLPDGREFDAQGRQVR
jgi:hypothetical protein